MVGQGGGPVGGQIRQQTSERTSPKGDPPCPRIGRWSCPATPPAAAADHVWSCITSWSRAQPAGDDCRVCARSRACRGNRRPRREVLGLLRHVVGKLCSRRPCADARGG